MGSRSPKETQTKFLASASFSLNHIAIWGVDQQLQDKSFSLSGYNSDFQVNKIFLKILVKLSLNDFVTIFT